jgi:UDP-N-acetylglucosamine acyltransferase
LAKIHPSAIVDPKAELAADVEVGPFALIECGVRIGAHSRIGPRAHVCSGTILGENCEVHIGAVLGHLPQDFSYKNEPSVLEIGDGTVVREYATLHRATGEGRKTEIGKKCYLMGGAHVAHNCKLGCGVILANNVLLAGHVEIGDGAILSGGVVVHQFVRIGDLAMLSGGSRFGMDVPPYVIGDETNAVTGLNSVGLRRSAKLSDDDRREIRKAFKIFFRSGLDLSDALRSLRAECGGPAVRRFVEFFETPSRRGYCRYRPGSRYGGRCAKSAKEVTDVGKEE